MGIEAGRRELLQADFTIHQSFSFSSSTPIPIYAVIPAYGVQPGSKICITIEMVQGAKYPQKNLLGQIFRLLIFSRELICHSENPASIATDYFLPSSFLFAPVLAGKTPLDELAIFELGRFFPDRSALLGCHENLLLSQHQERSPERNDAFMPDFPLRATSKELTSLDDTILTLN
jgi:hypothetical protein